jgi:hypothetical protein
MEQLHRRYSDEQARFLFQSYARGVLTRREVQEALHVGKSRFFELWKCYRDSPQSFTVAYRRRSSSRISHEAETAIERELLREKELVENPQLPISGYNYSAIRDRLTKCGIEVSLGTIIDRAKKLDCHRPRKKRISHDREVLTASTGALVQHDGSTHLWSPYAQEKWTLITSIDDFTRYLLFADFFSAETTWAHISAVHTVVERFGVALCYYVDSLRVFRFVQGRDSFWRKHVLHTDEVETQWHKMMHRLGVNVVFALSPQAKGKVERPYRWLQDRIVRTCALERISSLKDVRTVLREEVNRYNHHQVHSTTREIPAIRLARAFETGNCLFRPFTSPAPYTSPDDVFCLQEQRQVDAYHRISLFTNQIKVPHVPLRANVNLHMIPREQTNSMHIRIWWKDQMVHSLSLPLSSFPVHF